MNKTGVEKNIVLAEDDNDDVLVFELALKEMSFPVLMRHADNGDTLFVLLEDKVPDMLFLDVHMPCKDGITCITEIRKAKEYDNMPVVIYSSSVAEKTVEQTFRNGANLYMTKTNTINELSDKLRKVFAFDWANYMHYPPMNQFVLG